MARLTSMHKNTKQMQEKGQATVEAAHETIQPEGSTNPRRSSDREREVLSRGSLNDGAVDKHEKDYRSRIAERAFMLYEESGFRHGHDVEHWLEAERQVRNLGV